MFHNDARPLPLLSYNNMGGARTVPRPPQSLVCRPRDGAAAPDEPCGGLLPCPPFMFQAEKTRHRVLAETFWAGIIDEQHLAIRKLFCRLDSVGDFLYTICPYRTTATVRHRVFERCPHAVPGEPLSVGCGMLLAGRITGLPCGAGAEGCELIQRRMPFQIAAKIQNEGILFPSGLPRASPKHLDT